MGVGVFFFHFVTILHHHCCLQSLAVPAVSCTLTLKSRLTNIHRHQEDDTGLGATWPTLSSHAESRQVTQTCQVHQLCCTWPKKRCRGQVCPKASQFHRLGQFQGLGQDSQDIQCHIQMI